MQQLSFTRPIVGGPWRISTLVLGAALVGMLGLRLWSAQPRFATSPSGQPPASPAIEDRWGIRFTQVGVTADGGMVDLRYQVLDPDKALPLVEDSAHPPVLVADDGTRVEVTALMPIKHDLAAGRGYFWLYQNTRGAIKPGSRVHIEVGDLHLDDMPAL